MARETTTKKPVAKGDLRLSELRVEMDFIQEATTKEK